MDYDTKAALLESFRNEMGMKKMEEEKNPRIEYIASSHTLKVNRMRENPLPQTAQAEHQSLDDKLRIAAEKYKRERQGRE